MIVPDPTARSPDYMLARYYAFSLGRFMAVDPGEDADPEDPQAWNKYAYARNNPLKFNDPDGEAAILAVAAKIVTKVAVGAAIGAAAGAAVETGKKVYDNVKQGKGVFDFTANDKKDIKAAAKGGAVTGALVALGGVTKLADTLVGSITTGAASSAAGGAVERATDSSEATTPLDGSEVARDIVSGGLGGGVAYGANQAINVAKDVVSLASSGMSEGAALDKAGPGIVAGARAVAKTVGGKAVPEQKKQPNP